MMEVQSIGDGRKFNTPYIRPSPLTPHVKHLEFLQNKPYSAYHCFKNNPGVYAEVNKSYKPKIHFPPRTGGRKSTTNDYCQKVSLKDLMDTLEIVDNTPQINSESSSEKLEISSSSNSPSSPERYSPPPDYTIPPEWISSSCLLNNYECNTAKDTIPDINPDLKKRLLLFRKRNTIKLIQKMNYSLNNKRGLSEEEENEYVKKIHLLSSDFSEINLYSPNIREKNKFHSDNSETCNHESLYIPRDLLKISECKSSTSSYSSKITSKSSMFRKSLRPEKPVYIFQLPEWWKRRNEHFNRKIEEREDCICSRPSVTVLCRVCGFRAFSRLKETCKIHPYIVFLSDIERCGTCYTYAQLGLFLELDFKGSINSLK